MYNRAIRLTIFPQKTFFLWGPRQVGKTSILRKMYGALPQINLLMSEEFAAYQARPELLRERALQNKWKCVVIDEIQKVPQLLDGIQYLIEEHKMIFVMCGSSARKLRANHANLLGGRAIRYEMFGLVSQELGDRFDLQRMLNHGYTPSIYDSDKHALLLKSYCADYLKEEVFAEGLVRKLGPFSRFLEIAALGDTQIVSYETIARDCGVSAPTVKSYFEILSDTLLGHFLPAYAIRPKRRQTLIPKFYFADVGVVNLLAQRGPLRAGSADFGLAFENFIHHEIRAWIEYHQRQEQLSYWQLTTGVEVDFILGHMKCAIEAKSRERITSDHMKGLRELKEDYPEVSRRIIVSRERLSRRTTDGIEILSVPDFLKELWNDAII